MILEKIVVGALATNCYIIASDKSKKAAVIDPGADADLILQRLKQLDLRLELIINTHGHYDHTGADSELLDNKRVPVYIGGGDLKMLNDSSANLALFLGEKDIRVEAAKSLQEGEVLRLDDLTIRIIETPGHTGGSISLLVGDKLFTGDLLFQGSVGRTDFPGSSYSDLMESLNKISDLPDNTIVHPGHGPSTVLGEEKQTNPFLLEAAK
jgi:hydroxyacylglutathione hydrolase